MDESKRMGYKYVYLATTEGQDAAMKLYQKMGFIELGQELAPMKNIPIIGRLLVAMLGNQFVLYQKALWYIFYPIIHI